MIYHHIAVHAPLGLLTYAHPHALPPGKRVRVSFRRKVVVGVVWAAGVEAEIDPAKILPVIEVFEQEACLPDSWRQLLAFAARYYHYPLGQAVFAALPQGLREIKPVSQPQEPYCLTFSSSGREQAAPPVHHRQKFGLWQALSVPTDVQQLAKRYPQASKQLAAWQEQGWVEAVAAPQAEIMPSLHCLNEHQQAAADAVKQQLGQFATFLLYGVTGSGKTEVYFDVMAEVLAAGRQVLFLLPEINLTPQLLARLETRFGGVPSAVLHSQTAAGKRTQDYLRAMSGQAKLVIGTRLAVFTPLADLGLVVVDEEHDASFKQDNELRYHARDLAVWRGQQAHCPVLLGSATPSLESWHKAHSGAYRLLELPGRAREQARLPQVEILDVRRQLLDNGFSAHALQLLQKNHAAGGMSLVYLNRRGFSPALFCGDCGHTFGCPRCSAKMVLHQRAGQLRCHHCDYRMKVPAKCPDCGNQDLSAVGYGTQRVEEVLGRFLPKARIVRVDRDSTANKNDWSALYQQIEQNQVDILVGTQMLAKGHDFGRLNLVVVMNADGSLYSADFRAPEKLFAELMQVAGRAGRGELAGRVVIQTQLPEHPVFAAVQAQDYRCFADHELAEREQFGMPPFAFQAAVRADAEQVQEAMRLLEATKEAVSAQLPSEISVFGPAPMLMVRLAERERAQLFIETPSRQALHRAAALFGQFLQQHAKSVRWSLDIDPQDM